MFVSSTLMGRYQPQFRLRGSFMSTAHRTVAGQGTLPCHCPGSFWGPGQQLGGSVGRGRARHGCRKRPCRTKSTAPHICSAACRAGLIPLIPLAAVPQGGGSAPLSTGITPALVFQSFPSCVCLAGAKEGKNEQDQPFPLCNRPRLAAGPSAAAGRCVWLCQAAGTRRVPAAELSRKPVLSAQHSTGSGPVPGHSPPGSSCFSRSRQRRFVRDEAVTPWSRAERAAPQDRAALPGYQAQGRARGCAALR